MSVDHGRQFAFSETSNHHHHHCDEIESAHLLVFDEEEHHHHEHQEVYHPHIITSYNRSLPVLEGLFLVDDEAANPLEFSIPVSKNRILKYSDLSPPSTEPLYITHCSFLI